MPVDLKCPIIGLDFDRISFLSKSQAGQDLFVIAVTQGKKNGRWLELGCAHPKYGNNTWLLEKEFLWTGESVDLINPLDSPKQQAWKSFYRNIRSFFGNDAPSEWIPDPKDIYALSNRVQKELIEIHEYDLYVGNLSDDITAIDTYDWYKERPGAKFIIADALQMDFARLQGPYDYLQIDIDDHYNHCALLESIIQKHEFGVVTFEHDFWRKTEVTNQCRYKSRQIMQSAGYVLLCTDITIEPSQGTVIDNEPIYFEDWYVHPSRVDKKIVDTYKCVSQYPRPLYYSDVLFNGK